MKVKQIAEILTTMYNEVTGESAIVSEDLTGIIDTGVTLEKVGETLLSNGVDNYVKSLINRIGRTIYVGRTYTSKAPNILKDAFEFGSVLAKVRCDVGDYSENESWKLERGKSYDCFKFTPPTAEVKFFNSKTTYQLEISYTEMQVKESFSSAAELSRFFATIENRINLKKELANEIMTMRTINNMIGCKIAKNNNVVNLLAMYKTATGDTDITVNTALTSESFIRFAYKTINNYSSFLTRASSLYNESGYVTFTPEEKQKLVLLTDFATSGDSYLLSTTYHSELISLKGYSTTPYWQGSGDNPQIPFSTASTINVVTNEGDTVIKSGIVGVLFDEDACCICNENPVTTSQFVPSANFTNFWHMFDCSYLNDLAENCVVFTIED